MYDHDDYMTYHEHCASLEVRNLTAGDVVWIPSFDSFNPWRQMVEITACDASGWIRVRTVGGGDVRGRDEISTWLAPASLVYCARTVAETELAERS